MEAMLVEAVLGFTRTGCTDTLVHAHVLHVLGCGLNSCECSKVIVRTCKFTGCTCMLVQVPRLHH